MTEKKILAVNCFHCKKLIKIKYVRASEDYSQKNNWGYWTENEENKRSSVCDDCLMALYYQHKWEFRQLIKNKKKQTLFRQYVANGTIKGKPERVFIANRQNSSGCCSHCPKKKKKTVSDRKDKKQKLIIEKAGILSPFL